MWGFPITFMQKYLLVIGDFELYTKFSNLVKLVILHYNLFKYFFKNSSKCLEMSVDAYNSTLCKNPWVFFEKFEQIILFCSLDQFGFFYCNPYLFCSSAHELFPACSPPYQTLKSRRMDPLEYFWSMELCPLLSVQNWFSQKLALTSFCFWQTNLATLFIIQRDYDLEFLATPRVA